MSHLLDGIEFEDIVTYNPPKYKKDKFSKTSDDPASDSSSHSLEESEDDSTETPTQDTTKLANVNKGSQKSM